MLTVVDDVETWGHLSLNDVGNRGGDVLSQEVVIDGVAAAALLGSEQQYKIVRPRQAAAVRGENARGAA